MGAASGPNQFWQLFTLPAAGTRWSLVTPPEVPTNGALVIAPLGGAALAAGIRPALALHYSPVTATGDGGQTWAAGPVNAGLADVPDAVAASADGRLLALDAGGQVVTATLHDTSWATLASEQALAGTPAGRGCGLAGLTAAAYTPQGTPLLAGACTRPGTAGIFAGAGRTWRASGPALPAPLAGQAVQVLRLTRTGARDTALLQAGTGAAAVLLAAWSADGSHWTVSAPMRLAGQQVQSASLGTSGAVAVTLSGNRADTIAGPGSAWQALPALPAGRTVTLALPATGGIDALAAAGSKLSVWRLGSGPAAWTRTQTIHVPVQYGSSS